MFQFPAFAFLSLCIQDKILLINLPCILKPISPKTLTSRLRNYSFNQGWVSPFGNRRIKAYSQLPRRLSQRITSFIACACQGIHQNALKTLDLSHIQINSPFKTLNEAQQQIFDFISIFCTGTPKTPLQSRAAFQFSVVKTKAQSKDQFSREP